MGFYCHPKSLGLDFGTLDLGLGLDNLPQSKPNIRERLVITFGLV